MFVIAKTNAITDGLSCVFTGTELQLWHFHVAAIQYNFPSRPHIKEFLLSTPFNSEEDNYKLSLQREPLAKKSESVS